MIPKTCAYMWVIVMGLQLLFYNFFKRTPTRRSLFLYKFMGLEYLIQ